MLVLILELNIKSTCKLEVMEFDLFEAMNYQWKPLLKFQWYWIKGAHTKNSRFNIHEIIANVRRKKQHAHTYSSQCNAYATFASSYAQICCCFFCVILALIDHIFRIFCNSFILRSRFHVHVDLKIFGAI